MSPDEQLIALGFPPPPNYYCQNGTVNRVRFATSAKAKEFEKEKEGNYLHQSDASSAYLRPKLCYDTDINLEYMDMEDFLSENGLSVIFQALGNKITHCNSFYSKKLIPIVKSVEVSPDPSMMPSIPRALSAPNNTQLPHQLEGKSIVSSPGPMSPAEGENEIKIDFSLSPCDKALACIPGKDDFDPRKRSFSEEELKPQPMLKKSKKIFIHNEAKDDDYWARRKKNNAAAKRSRDARRVKENQIALRAAFLEKENSVLRSEMKNLKKENRRLNTSLSKYEPQAS